MSRESVLARGRAAALAGMVDTCTIRRAVGSVVDDNTGAEVVVYADVYTGKCRVQQRTVQAQQETPGEDYQLLVRLEVQLPMAAAGLRADDEITITASPRDVELVGQVFLVRDLPSKTDATARRVGVTRRTS